MEKVLVEESVVGRTVSLFEKSIRAAEESVVKGFFVKELVVKKLVFKEFVEEIEEESLEEVEVK